MSDASWASAWMIGTSQLSFRSVMKLHNNLRGRVFWGFKVPFSHYYLDSDAADQLIEMCAFTLGYGCP